MNQVIVPEAQASPVLKWAGGKGRLLAQYQKRFPRKFGRYFEPFLGGAAVFFHLAPKGAARLTDINEDLINLYMVLQQAPDPLIARLEDHRERHCAEYYYEVRSQRSEELKPVDRAARLLYLNKTCYNGLYRVNSRGHFNVPVGRYLKPSILQPEKLAAAHRALREVELAVAPYHTVLEHAEAGDFVYFDPPYQPLSSTSSFTTYTKESFGEKQQAELRDVFAELVKRKVKVMLSNSDAPLIRELYADFEMDEVRAARMINSKADRREAVGELLIRSSRKRKRQPLSS